MIHMSTQEFTPQQSLQLITQVIEEARARFSENGFSFILWGSLSVIASVGQFILLKMEYYDISYYPYFLMIGGGLVEFIYRSRRAPQHNRNVIYRAISILWLVIALNVFLIAFGFPWKLQQNLSPLILIFISIGVLITGTSLKDKLVIWAGIELNLAGILCFFIDWEYHALVMAIATFFGILVPGLILRYRHQNR